MLLKEKVEIETWLKLNYVNKYELIEDEEYGYIVNVNDSVYLFNRKLKKICVKFNIINGTFDCGENELISLEGCPEIVKGNFDCHNNKLKSLQYSPEIVKGNFDCHNNKLKSLQYSPEIVKGNFDCDINELKSLIGASKSIDGNFYCSRNEIESLEGCPQFINGKLWCNNNKLNIDGVINLKFLDIKHNYVYLENNPELGELQYRTNCNEVKKILTIYQEKKELNSLLTTNDNLINKIIKV